MKKILSLVIFTILFITACNRIAEEPKDTPKEAGEKHSINEVQVVENIEFGEMKLEYQDGVTFITMNIRNISDEMINLTIFNMELFNENDEFIFGAGITGKELNAGEVWEFEREVDFDVSNAVSVKYEVTID